MDADHTLRLLILASDMFGWYIFHICQYYYPDGISNAQLYAEMEKKTSKWKEVGKD
jgi:hypothetical protein